MSIATSPVGSTPRHHACEVDELLATLQVDPSVGLTRDDAAERRAEAGPNELERERRRPTWLMIVDQFRNLLIVILMAAAAVAAALGDFKDAVVIGAVLVVNAVVGFLQERRARQSMDALGRMLIGTARVRRDGRTCEIDVVDVVPGDILLLEAGDRVAADGRLLAGSELAIDESSLTGESMPVDKAAAGPLPVDTPLADQHNSAHMNTVATRGRGELLVTATGMSTSIGQLARLLQTTQVPSTPLQRQLGVVAHRLAAIAAVAVGLVLALALLQGDGIADASVDAIALAVAAIPEGLPAVVTVTLAVGTAQMARHNAIVKRLPSVETLGSATVVCTDKTGTLTRNEMTARRVWWAGSLATVSGDGYGAAGDVVTDRGSPIDRPDLAAALVLCNDADVRDGSLIGDPTEGALLTLAAKVGADADRVRADRPRVAELPFDSAAKLMATVHSHDDDGYELVVKGAPDVVLGRATRAMTSDGVAELTASRRAELERVIAAMGDDGLRVLAVATRHLPADVDLSDVAALVRDVTVGVVVGIVDPLRPEALAAVETCRSAGIRVKMITGDHATTATAIAKQLGLDGDVVSGSDLEAMSDDELAERIERISVFARVAPVHKLRIVEALQRRGHVVSMTGDGVNDAPALKGADIGVAMGQTGTDVAKEAADVVLVDDDFATIVIAVERGRTLYDNIVSFVRFQLATNVGAIATILVARLLGMASPFTAIQILWVNLIMDGPPAMALGVDPPRADTMSRPPRPLTEQVLSGRRLRALFLSGAVMAAGTLGVYAWAREAHDADLAGTLAFTTFVLFQFCNALNVRTGSASALGRHTLRNPQLWTCLVGVLLLQVAVVHTAVGQGIFDTVGLSPAQWLLAAAVASSILAVEELRKLTVRARRRQR